MRLVAVAHTSRQAYARRLTCRASAYRPYDSADYVERLARRAFRQRAAPAAPLAGFFRQCRQPVASAFERP